jgi:hypothetical protein
MFNAVEDRTAGLDKVRTGVIGKIALSGILSLASITASA